MATKSSASRKDATKTGAATKNAKNNAKKGAGAGHGVRWLPAPEEHDFPAAADYLSLIAGPKVSDALVASLRAGEVTYRKAKDILRASGLPLLDQSNAHVSSDLHKVRAGKPLSPVLLVRGDLARGLPAQVADGYHRVCASYWVDENTDIPVVIADLPR